MAATEQFSNRAGKVGIVSDTTAVVRLVFDSSEDRSFRLPGSGSPSLLYVFEGKQIGALAETSDGEDLTPGTSHEGVRLTFWAPESEAIVRPPSLSAWGDAPLGA